MSSELYWDNLGLEHPEKMKEVVVSNAYEIRNFLNWAKNGLELKVYSFNFKIQRIREYNGIRLEGYAEMLHANHRSQF